MATMSSMLFSAGIRRGSTYFGTTPLGSDSIDEDASSMTTKGFMRHIYHHSWHQVGKLLYPFSWVLGDLSFEFRIIWRSRAMDSSLCDDFVVDDRLAVFHSSIERPPFLFWLCRWCHFLTSLMRGSDRVIGIGFPQNKNAKKIIIMQYTMGGFLWNTVCVFFLGEDCIFAWWPSLGLDHASPS